MRPLTTFPTWFSVERHHSHMICDHNMSIVQLELLLLKLSESSSLSRHLEYHKTKDGNWRRGGTRYWDMLNPCLLNPCWGAVFSFGSLSFHSSWWQHLFSVCPSYGLRYLCQWAAPSIWSYSSITLKCFYIPLKSPGKSRQQPLQTTTSAISSLQECSPLSQSQHNHGHLDLSMYFSPMDHTLSINMVSCGICIHLVSSFSLAQHTSSAQDHTPPIFSLPFLNQKQKFSSPWLSQSGCTSHLWWPPASWLTRNEFLHIGN